MPLILPLPVADRLRAIARLQPPGTRHIPERRLRRDGGPPDKRQYPLVRAPHSPLWKLEPGQCLTLKVEFKKLKVMVRNFIARNPGWEFSYVANKEGKCTVRCLKRAARKAKA